MVNDVSVQIVTFSMETIWALLFQSVVSLTSSLVVKMLTVLVSIIHRYFAEKKMWVASYSHFTTKLLVYMPYWMVKVLTIR